MRGATAVTSALEINAMDTENGRRVTTFISRDVVCEQTAGSTESNVNQTATPAAKGAL